MIEPLVTDLSASILVVEDSPINQRQLQSLLTKQGYHVTVANHGKEALAKLEFLRPDLILLDVVMPEMDGLALCHLLKADPATREIPVIFISSLDHTTDKLSGFAAGGVDYITKPFHPSEVMARISTHLHLRLLQRQLAANNLQLAEEKRKSEALLLNVLPARVAQELMERGSCSPQHFAEVSVCFVDIVRFTDIAALLPPELLISELNTLFTAFDRIVEAHHPIGARSGKRAGGGRAVGQVKADQRIARNGLRARQLQAVLDRFGGRADLAALDPVAETGQAAGHQHRQDGHRDGEFDQADGHRRRILAGDHDAHPLVPHFTDNRDQPGNQVRALDVLVSLVKNHQLVEATPIHPCVGKQLEQHDE